MRERSPCLVEKCPVVTTNEGGYCSDHIKPCSCGCGGRARYAYMKGHRPNTKCKRCGKKFAAFGGDLEYCSQCRRHLKAGFPEVLNNTKTMNRTAPEGKKWCSACSQYKLLKFFKVTRNGMRYSRCGICRKLTTRERHWLITYNITVEQYNALKEAQGGRCAICNVATGARRALAVDHDHSCCSGKTSCGKCVRGLLCSPCNKALGHFRDKPESFIRAANYLTSPPAYAVWHKNVRI